jgi:hypothetical protein
MKMKRPARYSTGHPELDARLAEIVRSVSSGEKADYVLQLATSAVKLALDGSARVDLKLANAALKEMRYAMKVFAPYHHTRKVTVFGSARTAAAHSDYEQAVTFGRLMAESGWMVVTGAGSGIMGAANEGAGRSMSFGVNIRLPFEQEANRVIQGDRKLLHFRYFFTRKLFLLKESSAVCLFPGGFGTLDETFEVLTLLQTGKQTPLPVVMVDGPSGYFRNLVSFVEENLAGLISPTDHSLFRVVDSPEAARREIESFYRVYHSSRYAGDWFVVRLTRPLESEEVEGLNRRFSDLLRSGRIEPAAALPEDQREPALASLSFLRMNFNRRDFGRLRQFIDALNDLG